MPQIAEDYVSPSVRWGLLKQDYPDAVVEFTHSLGVDIGIPENFGGKDEYCVAQILLRPTDELPIVGYKPVSDARSNKNDHPSDAWNVLCTKALGRAVKRAGYDDTASNLKILVTYQQRKAEHDAISGGGNSTPDGDYLHRAQETSNVVEMELKAEEVAVEEDDEWDTTEHRTEAHSLLKNAVAALPSDLLEEAREIHQKLNGRQWPIESVSQYNHMMNAVDGLHEKWQEQESLRDLPDETPPPIVFEEDE